MSDIHAPPARRRSFWWYLEGRAGRAEYWAMVAVTLVLGLLLERIPAVSIAVSLALAIAQCRRLHDFGRTGIWALLALLGPILAGLPLLFLVGEEAAALVAVAGELVGVIWIGAVRGDASENRFGSPAPLTLKRFLTGR